VLKRIFFDLDISIENINIGNIKEDNYNSIQLIMNIVDDGKAFDFSSVAYTQISIQLPDESVSNSLCAIEKNKVMYLMEPNALHMKGLHKAEVQFYAVGHQLLITTTFHYNVIDALYNDEDLTEQEKYPILIELIDKSERLLKLIEEYLNHKFIGIQKLDFYNNGYAAEYVDGSSKDWTYNVDDKGQIIELANHTDNKIVSISWNNTER
jgi:hypothetical protein